MIINKEQTDSLGWTDEKDPNDVIMLDENGNIIKRRFMMGLIPDGKGNYNNYSFWYELEDGEWKFNSERH